MFRMRLRLILELYMAIADENSYFGVGVGDSVTVLPVGTKNACITQVLQVHSM